MSKNLRSDISNIMAGKEGKWMTSSYIRKHLTRAATPAGLTSTLKFLADNGYAERRRKLSTPGNLNAGRRDNSSWVYKLVKEYSPQKNYTDHRKSVATKTHEHTTATPSNDITLMGDLLGLSRQIVRSELKTREIVDELLRIAETVEANSRIVTINVGGSSAS